MKRQRATGSGKGQSSSKEEPPKKVKRVKAAAPAVLGSLPLYGEQLPDNGSADLPPAARQTCSQLRSVFERVRELKSSGSSDAKAGIEAEKHKGMVLFSVLKKLNRLSHLYSKDAREQTHEQKLEVDDLHLQLQNLMYEAMHLQKEITNCLEFKSQHEDIELVSEEAFYSDAPPTVTRSEVTRTDEHQRMLSQLEWELAQRKQLAGQQGGLEAAIAEQEKVISAQEEALSSLHPALDTLRKATLPIQQLLAMPLDHIREQDQLATLLPPPLYILYMQARAYAEVEDSTLSVTIVGEASDARAFHSALERAEQSDEDSGDSDTEGGKEDTSRRRKKHRKRGKASASEQRDVTRAFPLTVTLALALPGIGSLHVTLSYLPHFSAVCAAVTTVSLEEISDIKTAHFADKSSLLHCLFDADTGRTSPNSLVSLHIRKHGGDNFSLAVKQHGFPYKWVQRVCGISISAEAPEAGAGLLPLPETSAEFVGCVVEALKKRFTAQVYLTHQTVSLDEQCLLLPPSSPSSSSSTPHCQISLWTQISAQDVQALQFGSVAVLNLQERTNRFYTVRLQLLGASLSALVCVGTDYPTVPPCFTVSVESASGKETHSIHIKNLEAEVNINLPLTLSGDSSGQFLLSCQLRRLQECFDAFAKHADLSPEIKSKPFHKISGRGRLMSYSC